MPVDPHAAHMANDGASCDRQESDKRDDEEGGNQSPSSHAGQHGSHADHFRTRSVNLDPDHLSIDLDGEGFDVAYASCAA